MTKPDFSGINIQPKPDFSGINIKETPKRQSLADRLGEPSASFGVSETGQAVGTDNKALTSRLASVMLESKGVPQPTRSQESVKGAVQSTVGFFGGKTGSENIGHSIDQMRKDRANLNERVGSGEISPARALASRAGLAANLAGEAAFEGAIKPLGQFVLPKEAEDFIANKFNEIGSKVLDMPASNVPFLEGTAPTSTMSKADVSSQIAEIENYLKTPDLKQGDKQSAINRLEKLKAGGDVQTIAEGQTLGEWWDNLDYSQQVDLKASVGIASLLSAGTIKLKVPKVKGGTTSVVADLKSIEKPFTKYYDKAIVPQFRGANKTPAGRAKYNANAKNAIKTILDRQDDIELLTPDGDISKSKLPENLGQFEQAITQTKTKVLNEYQALTKQASGKGAVIDVAPIKENLTKSINDKQFSLLPDVKSTLNKYVDLVDKMGNVDLVTAESVLKNLNTDLKSFYQGQGKDTAGAVLAKHMVANNLRKQLDDAASNAAGEYKGLKKAYGSLAAIEKDVTHRALVEGRKAPAGFFELSDIFSAGDLARGMAGDPLAIVQGATQIATKRGIKLLNDKNKMIKKMFKEADTASIRTPHVLGNEQQNTQLAESRKGEALDTPQNKAETESLLKSDSSPNIVPETPVNTKESVDVLPDKTPKSSSTTPKDSGKIGEMTDLSIKFKSGKDFESTISKIISDKASRYGASVSDIKVGGSVAKGTARLDSDIDIIIDTGRFGRGETMTDALAFSKGLDKSLQKYFNRPVQITISKPFPTKDSPVVSLSALWNKANKQ